MHSTDKNLSRSAITRCTTAAILALALLVPQTARVLAGAGHSHGDEFGGSNQSSHSLSEIRVDRDTLNRLGMKVQPVNYQTLAFGIKTTGQVEALPNQAVQVTAPVSGTVTRFLVAPGDRVKAGQAVAVMSSPELAMLRTDALDRRADAIAALQQAQADVQLAKQNYTQQLKLADADIAEAKTARDFASESYERDKMLLGRGAIPRRQLLESETKLAAAEAALAKAESRLPVSEANAQLQRSRSALNAAQTRVRLSQETYATRLQQLGANANTDGTITIKAPITGIIGDWITTLGESAEGAGKPIGTIVNPRNVRVSANIYEKDIDRVQVGQRVQVTGQPLASRTYTGRVSIIGTVVEGTTRVVPVKANLDNPDALLKPGMFLELEILTDRTSEPVLTVPNSAVVETNNNQQLVFVQNGSAYQPVEVTLGRSAAGLVEIKGNIFEGDRVVTEGATQLYAQLLRGGGETDSDHDDHDERNETTANPAGILPWWLILLAVGAIGAGLFGMGWWWLRRNQRRSEAREVEPVSSLNESEVSEIAPDGISVTSTADSDKAPAALPDPHQFQ